MAVLEDKYIFVDTQADEKHGGCLLTPQRTPTPWTTSAPAFLKGWFKRVEPVGPVDLIEKHEALEWIHGHRDSKEM